MRELVQLLGLGALLAGFSAAIVARVRQAWLGRTILLILLAPAIPMAVIFALGALFSPATGTVLYGLVFAIMLIGTIILVPWLLACGAGVAIGLILRRKRPREPASASAPPQVQSSPLQRLSASPPQQTYLASSAPKPHFSQSSPDGSIRIDIAPVEWAAGQVAHTPRVIETATGRILCDLLGSDWEAHTSYPRDRYVWLGLRRFRSPGHLFVEFDLDADRYRIALNTLEHTEEEGPLGDISDRLEHWWKRATMLATTRADKEIPVSAPGPFAAWRTALIILIGALAAIAGLTYMSMTYGIDPPKVPAVPRIPSFPR